MSGRISLTSLALVGAMVATGCSPTPPNVAIIDAPNDYQLTALEPVRVDLLPDGNTLARQFVLSAGEQLQVLVDDQGRLTLLANGTESLIANGVEHFSVRNKIGRHWEIRFVGDTPDDDTAPRIRVFPAP